MMKQFILAFLSCLLAVQYIFAQTPSSAVVEFTQGKTAKFSTKGHPKSKGAVFTIKYPQSWSAEEGERPNIVQKFASESGKGFEMALIVTSAIPPNIPLTKASIKDILSQESLKKELPEGATF